MVIKRQRLSGSWGRKTPTSDDHHFTLQISVVKNVNSTGIMKAVAIAMVAMMGLFVLTEPIQAAHYGDFTYCKSGAKVKNQKACKENGGKQ